MPLKGKYIKYSKKITFEIFKLIYDKLVYCKFEPIHTLERAWKEFSGEYNYMWCHTENEPNQFRSCSSKGILEETTVQEILGYDPFVKEDFVLPKKWCIKHTNNKELHEFFENYNHGGYFGSSNNFFHYPRFNGENCLSLEIKSGYIEITFDQFQKYVLKKTVEETKATEKDWTKATKEELLEEAKRRYPIGTKFRSLTGGTIHTVDKYVVNLKNSIRTVEDSFSTIYRRDLNEWAEVISLPEQKAESKVEQSKRPSFYVRYCEEFTLDLFNKLMDWCKVNNTQKPRGVNDSYNGLRIYKYFLYGEWGLGVQHEAPKKPKSVYGYGVDSNRQGCRNEYSIQQVKDLIGYVEPESEGNIDVEYFECVKPLNGVTVGVIYKAHNGIIEHRYLPRGDQFKPSTKEAYDAQNKPKFIEKWSVGSYVVFLRDRVNSTVAKKGDINLIIDECWADNLTQKKTKQMLTFTSYSEITDIKWFATKSEAEEFAKTLIEPVNEGVKQPLKQAVHCKTQEEWDFVLSKLPKSFTLSEKKDMFTRYNDYYKHEGGIAVNVDGGVYCGIGWYKDEGYQILSFQEWCDLNGYKVESKEDIMKEKYDEFSITQLHEKGLIKNVFEEITKIPFEKLEDKSLCSIKGFAGRGCQGLACKDCLLDSNNRSKLKELLIGISSEKPKETFKAGDWITITKSSINWSSNMTKLDGKTVQLTSIDKNGRNARFEGSTSWCWNYSQKHFRKATQEEIDKTSKPQCEELECCHPKFKVGDYIFVMASGHYYGDVLEVIGVVNDEKNCGVKGSVWISHKGVSFSGGGFRHNKTCYKYGEYVRHATLEEIAKAKGLSYTIGDSKPEKQKSDDIQFEYLPE